MLHWLILLAITASSLSIPTPHLSKSNIIGGQQANSIPYQVSLKFNGRHVCGGSILAERAILTAGHCMILGRPESYKVRAGTNTISKGGQLMQVDNVITHPDFKLFPLDYDIAILFLNDSLQFYGKVYSIPMANVNETILPGTMATISGWGLEHEDDLRGPENLKAAKIPIISRKKCLHFLRYVTERMICAGYDEGKVDGCSFDSGGPLVIHSKLVGVISSGIGCGRQYSYGVYTSVPYIRFWIDKTLEP